LNRDPAKTAYTTLAALVTEPDVRLLLFYAHPIIKANLNMMPDLGKIATQTYWDMFELSSQIMGKTPLKRSDYLFLFSNYAILLSSASAGDIALIEDKIGVDCG